MVKGIKRALRAAIERIRNKQQYRICKHNENWDRSTSDLDHYRVECLQWVQMAGQFTSYAEAQGYADTIGQTALKRAVTNKNQAAEIRRLRNHIAKTEQAEEGD